jgi:hypothetical protein
MDADALPTRASSNGSRSAWPYARRHGFLKPRPDLLEHVIDSG